MIRKKLPYFALLASLLCMPAYTHGQSYREQRLEFAAYNVGLNALMGGIGAAINKKPGQTAGNAFLKGLGKGAAGGLLIHQAKAAAHRIDRHEKLGWAWPARLTNALGSSIVQNAATNRGMLDQLHLNLWLVRADYDLKEKQFLMRLLPTAVYGAVKFTNYGHLDLRRSLHTGYLYYQFTSQELLDQGVYGRSLSMAIGVGTPYYSEYMYHEVVAHEVVHGLQYESGVWINAYLHKPDASLKKHLGWYKTLGRFVYLDANTLVQKPMRLFGRQEGCYLSRFSEKEAHHYATRSYISCEETYGGFFPIR
ncbi:hypothetical protein [Cesiribacter andamanensis]|uniref:Uncharacterized protein n=1 Tax=Cesiribacter andamanensis AMV16 TaxID=1279009 RepID=M7NT26_9BACT|nr:hypothetical protein [Cesiribacter andamanensis]EMR01639.1 hypothetical protein ADICEAN_03235 [Cesiribacter andamanensis AMV16]